MMDAAAAAAVQNQLGRDVPSRDASTLSRRRAAHFTVTINRGPSSETAMRKIALPSGLGLVVAISLYVAPAQAQLARTFVSAASGNDANDCSRLTPCRTFPGALGKTLAGGEITVVDPGGYGAVNIDKAISIVADGVGTAGVLVGGGGTGITINAGATDEITLRGLTVNGLTGSFTGILFNTGRSLMIENCVIRNLGGTGILYQPNASSSLAVSNTLVADNGDNGIVVAPTGSGTVRAALNRVEAYSNSNMGIAVAGTLSTGTLNATAVDSVAANNASVGFGVFSAAGQAATRFMVVRSVAANNVDRGMISSGTNAIMRVGHSTITGNDIGVAVIGAGQLWSFGDNNIIDNGTDGTPAITPLK